MLGEIEVKSLLDRFDQADEDGELTMEGAGAHKALKWVMGIDDYAMMDELLPEDEEGCEECGLEECDCNSEEEENDVEG
jgi:hypothetical protein